MQLVAHVSRLGKSSPSVLTAGSTDGSCLLVAFFLLSQTGKDCVRPILTRNAVFLPPTGGSALHGCQILCLILLKPGEAQDKIGS